MATRVSERIKKKRAKQTLEKEQLQVARTYCEDRVDPDGFLEKHVSDYIGKGIFTDNDFKKGDFLLEYKGDLISYSEARKREKEYGEEYGRFIFFFKYKEMTMSIDATQEVFSMGRMINDAAHNDPAENCSMSVVVVNRCPHLCLFAIRDIPVGEELRYGYNDNIQLDEESIPLNGPSDDEDEDEESSGSDTDAESTERSPQNTAIKHKLQHVERKELTAKKRPSYVRHPWSEGEKAAVENFFDRQSLISNKLPGKKDCGACIQANPVLQSRSWRNIKDYCNNACKKK